MTGTKQTKCPTGRLNSVVSGDGARVDGLIGAQSRLRLGHALLSLAVLCLVALCEPGKLLAEETGTLVAAEENSDYRLGPQDKLRIKVFEWRPSRDEMFEWTAFNSEYTVGATGKLSLPLIGDMPAAGRSTAELAQSIAERFKERMGLAAKPDITIEIAQFRPFYVVGQVEKPGEYPYRPGMSLMQAVSIGGGLKRSLEGNVRLAREVYTTRGELNLYIREFSSLLARRARLQAEMKSADHIEFPTQLTAKGGAREIYNEHNLFSARREAYETQVSNLHKQRADLEREVTNLTSQLASHDKVMQLVRSELEDIEALARKGLSTAHRRLELQRNAAQLDGDRLRLESGLIKVRQEISKTEMTLIELRARRMSDVASEMQVTQQRLEQVSLKAETAQNLLYESRVMAPLSLTGGTNMPGIEPIYKVSRRSATGETQELQANEWTALEPGDIIKVELPPPIEGGNMPLPVHWDFQQSDLLPQWSPAAEVPAKAPAEVPGEKVPPSPRLPKEAGGKLRTAY